MEYSFKTIANESLCLGVITDILRASTKYDSLEFGLIVSELLTSIRKNNYFICFKDDEAVGFVAWRPIEPGDKARLKNCEVITSDKKTSKELVLTFYYAFDFEASKKQVKELRNKFGSSYCYYKRFYKDKASVLRRRLL